MVEAAEEAHKEIGRELAVSELHERRLVVIRPPRRPEVAMTMWVWVITDTTVGFYAGELGVYVMNFRTPAGKLVDDRGDEVHVYEYLGEP